MIWKTAFTILLIVGFFSNPCFAGPVNAPTAKQLNVQGPVQLQKRPPDLMIKSISTVPSQPKAGEQFEIRVVVENVSGITLPPVGTGQGGVTSADKYGPSRHHKPSGSSSQPTVRIPGTRSGATELTIKVGNNPPITFPVPALNPNNSVMIKRNYTAEYPGNLQIICTVDPRNTIQEANERNNTRSKNVHIKGPDFKIVKFFINSSSGNNNNIRVNDTITIYANIKNFGDAASATFMRFDIHGDIPNQQDIILHPEVPVPLLQPNKTTQVVYRFVPTQPGRYTFGGGVNTPVRVHEINEHNNVVPNIIQVNVKQAGIDLDLVSLYTNATSRHWYQDFVVRALVKNIGNQPSGRFNVHLYRPHDKPAGIAQGTWVDSVRRCPSLGPNKTCQVEFKFRYKIFVGSFRARVEVDPENQVQDINRSNNKRTIKLSVK